MGKSRPTVGANSVWSECDSAAGREKCFGHGVLHVEVFQARDIKGDEINGMGKADPYLKVKHGNARKPVTLRSSPHLDGGSHPIWNTQFCFPMRNGGTKDHNILDIEIWNENKNTRFFRGDNILGHLRLGGLADWITKHNLSITEPAWYPVFPKHHRRHRDQIEDEKRGEILVKFYFQNVDEEVFARGHHTEPRCDVIQSENGFHWSDDIKRAPYRREPGNRLSANLGEGGAVIGVTQRVIMLG